MNLEPIRALLELAQELQDGLDMIPEGTVSISSDEAFTIAASAPALSQLLEAVEGMENIEADMRRDIDITNSDSVASALERHANRLKSLRNPV